MNSNPNPKTITQTRVGRAESVLYSESELEFHLVRVSSVTVFTDCVGL